MQGVNDVLDVDGISTVQIDNWLQVSASESLLFLFHICALAQWSVVASHGHGSDRQTGGCPYS